MVYGCMVCMGGVHAHACMNAHVEGKEKEGGKKETNKIELRERGIF